MLLVCRLSEPMHAPLDDVECYIAVPAGLGFRQLYSDISVFVHGHGDEVNIISVHVDDTNILSPSIKRIEWLKKIVDAEYGFEDFGPTSYFLGIKLVRDRVNRTIEIHQQR